MSEQNKNNENNPIDNYNDDDNNFSLFRDSEDLKSDNSSKANTAINHRNQRSQNHLVYESIYSSSRKINNFEMPLNNNINKNINKNYIDEESKLIKEKEKKKIELEEKEKNKIRDKLKCFICFGKVINATMCIKCKGIACEECVKKMILRRKICINCNQLVKMEDMIKLPFMNDLASFFINNVEQKQSPKKNIHNQVFQEVEDNIKFNIIESCNFHPNKKLEYICLNCIEYFCSECLLFFNKKNVAKHENHIILSNDQLNEFNLNKIVKEYKTLIDLKMNKEKKKIYYNACIKEVELLKKRENDIIMILKKDLISNYSKQNNEIKGILKKLANKKDEIDKGIKTFSNQHFNRLIEGNSMNQIKKILDNFKKLNNNQVNKEDIEKSSIFKNALCCETYESDIIELEIPNNGHYTEELNILNKNVNFIPYTKCNLKSQLLFNSIVFTLIIEVNNEFYEKNSLKFLGDLLFLSKKTCEIVDFVEYYNKGEQVLYIEYEFSKLKSFLDENNKCKLKFLITKAYYK